MLLVKFQLLIKHVCKRFETFSMHAKKMFIVTSARGDTGNVITGSDDTDDTPEKDSEDHISPQLLDQVLVCNCSTNHTLFSPITKQLHTPVKLCHAPR